MRLRNFTPHAVNLNGYTFQPEGLARVEVTETTWSHEDFADGCIEFVQESKGQVIGLPEPEKDTFLIVSRMVKESSDRPDLACPTGFVRDDQGRILQATKLLV